MNIERFDIGTFIFFINVFTGNAGNNFSHHHEDLLSYVLYDNGREILIDPGKPNYLKGSDFHSSRRHNGIWCEEDLLRPVPRFFTPRSLFIDAIDLDIKKDMRTFTAYARNRHTGAERTLHIESGVDIIRVRETYKSGFRRLQVGFTHCFANIDIKNLNSHVIQIGGLNFCYGEDMRVTSVERALAYGEIGRAHQLSSDNVGCETIWELHHSA